jgi:hypothetical protein
VIDENKSTKIKKGITQNEKLQYRNCRSLSRILYSGRIASYIEKTIHAFNIIVERLLSIEVKDVRLTSPI